MFHNNDPHNYGGKREKLLQENPGVVINKWMAREDWHVLRATRADVDLPVRRQLPVFFSDNYVFR